MEILLTNDDGFNAKGIKILYEDLKKIANVTIVAPEWNQSTTSHSISLNKPLRCKKQGKNIYSVVGVPADCVNFAINSKLIETNFDLVISGINDGANIGDDINYSGTVGAAREGYLHGINSIAISIGNKKNPKFQDCSKFFVYMLEKIIESNKKKFFLNINYPNRRVEDIEGVKFTKQGARAYGHEIVTKTDPRGEEYFWIGGNDLSYKAEDGTDIAALREGYVSVTPLITNYTDNNFKKIEI